jgi:hypothetical protein
MSGSGPHRRRRRHRRLFQALLPTVYRACSLALDSSDGAEWTVFPSLFRTVIRFLGLLCQKRSLHRGKAALLTFQLLPLWPPGQQITSHTHALRESEFVYPDRFFFSDGQATTSDCRPVSHNRLSVVHFPNFSSETSDA